LKGSKPAPEAGLTTLQKVKFAVETLCFFVGALKRENQKPVYKVGTFIYDFKNNKWEMIWEKKEFKYRRDCILSLLPNKQGIQLITTPESFVNLLEKRNIKEYVDIDEAITPV
jgi:hypothetical protein